MAVHIVEDARHPTYQASNLRLAAEFRTLSLQLNETTATTTDHTFAARLRSLIGSSRWRDLLLELIPLRSAFRQQQSDQQQREAALNKIAVQLRNMNHHLETSQGVYARMNTSPLHGLEPAAVRRQQNKFGRNQITPPSRINTVRLFAWFFGGFNRFLWLAVVGFFLCWKPIGNPPQSGNLALGVVIIVIIFMQAMFSAWQEWLTARAMSSITSMIPAEAIVLRDGNKCRLPSAELVPGDLVYLNVGDKVPADIRLVNASADLMFDRSVLSGSMDPTVGTIEYTSQNYLETRNMAMMGINATQGSGVGVVVSTGDRTVLGRINRLTLRKRPARTILQLEVHRLVNGLTIASLAIGLLFIILWAAWLRTSFPGFMSASDAIANAVGVLVTLPPSSLPVAFTLALTAIAKRMQKHQVVLKDLHTVETLGTVNVICCEKSGTLTQRHMHATHLALADQEAEVSQFLSSVHRDGDELDPAIKRLYETLALCNDARFDPLTINLPVNERVATGDATDCALLRLAESMRPLRFANAEYNRLFTIPFNARIRYMLSVCSTTVMAKHTDGRPFMVVKGALETLIDNCATIQDSQGEIVPLDNHMRAKIEGIQRRWATENGCRVLLLCRRDFAEDNNLVTGLEDRPSQFYAEASELLKDLCIVGLVGMVDPPRREIPGVVDTFHKAGIRVFMASGDYAPTAAYVARQCGILTSAVVDSIQEVLNRSKTNSLEPSTASSSSNRSSLTAQSKDDLEKLESRRSLVISGSDLVGLQLEDWDVIASYEEIVFARITPDQKLQIVEELKTRSNYVAVTGDEVNDVPAMRSAHVGIAMGNGTEVAKESADIILLDNDFSSIVTAIQSGRLLFENLKKVIIYLLPMTNFSETLPSLLNVTVGLPIPLSTFLMLVINTMTDVWASVVLINEEPEDDIMLRPPRDPKRETLVNLRLFGQAYGFIGLIESMTGHIMFFLCVYLYGGIRPSQVFLAFNKWTDGYLGKTQQELANIVAVAGSSHFMALVVMQWANMFVARTRKRSIVNQNPLWGAKSNRKLLVAIPIAVGVALLFNEVEWFNQVFLTGQIPVEFFFLPLPFAVLLLVVEEVRKLVIRRHPRCLIAKSAW